MRLLCCKLRAVAREAPGRGRAHVHAASRCSPTSWTASVSTHAPRPKARSAGSVRFRAVRFVGSCGRGSISFTPLPGCRGRGLFGACCYNAALPRECTGAAKKIPEFAVALAIALSGYGALEAEHWPTSALHAAVILLNAVRYRLVRCRTCLPSTVRIARG